MFTKMMLSAFIATSSLGLILWRFEKPVVAGTNHEYASDPSNPVELGAVHWSRDLDAGLKASAESGKPVLILFQEVPGCSNCTRYGSLTLSHPLIVEAIETYFEPVCIYNNKGGSDAEALKRFGEPAWNNPVVRIVDAQGKDVAPRMADFRSTADLVSGIVLALGRKGQPIPEYLRLLDTEMRSNESGLETATYSMYCFWSGERSLGALPGVINTLPGFQNGREVVRVQYDPAKTNAQKIQQAVSDKGISNCSDNSGFKPDQEPKYYLAQTFWRFVPMTGLQASRANSLVGAGESPEAVLSPRQIDLGHYVETHPKAKWGNAIGAADLAAAWKLAGAIKSENEK